MTPATRTILRCAASFLVVGTACFVLLLISGLVSPQTMINSITRDAAEIEMRGDYPDPVFQGRFEPPIAKYMYDGFTDGIMLMQAIPDRNRNLVENAIMGPYYAIGDGTPGGDGTGGISPTTALLELVNNPTEVEQQRTYVLYWHGYVVPMRALLSIMSPMTIVILNVVVFILTSAAVFEVFRRTGGLAFAITWLIALLATWAWITPLGFQHFTAFHIAMLATVALYFVLKRSKHHEWVVPLFLITGLLTAFFDFLTIPLLTFLLPLSLYYLWLIKVRKEPSLLKSVHAGAAWLIGYAGFWATKWLVTAIFYSAQYANSEFAYALAHRGTAGDGGLHYRFAAIYNNLYQLFAFAPDGSVFMGQLFTMVAIAAAVLTAAWYALVKYTRTSHDQVKRAAPMLLVALGPYVWYFAVTQHSTFHSWFTWRLQVGLILGVIFFILLSIDWSALRKNKPTAKLREEG